MRGNHLPPRPRDPSAALLEDPVSQGHLWRWALGGFGLEASADRAAVSSSRAARLENPPVDLSESIYTWEKMEKLWYSVLN